MFRAAFGCYRPGKKKHKSPLNYTHKFRRDFPYTAKITIWPQLRGLGMSHVDESINFPRQPPVAPGQYE
jgi:hypothetical protein